MRLELTVFHSGREVRTVTLTSPQRATFGRSHEVDESFADPRLSRRHFEVFPRDDQWCVEDRGSSNGTRVNGQLVSSCLLAHGDTIQAGHLELEVKSLGGSQGRLSVVGTDGSVDSSVSSRQSVHDLDGIYESAARARLRKLGYRISESTSDTGNTRLSGALGDASPADLLLALRQLPQFNAPWLIADFGRMNQPATGYAAETGVPIINWLGPAMAQFGSPLLIPLAGVEFQRWKDLVESCWGHKAISVVFTTQSGEELLSAIRKASRYRDAITGVLWPNTLSDFLWKCRQSPAQPLLEAAEAILMEDPEDESRWQLFSASSAAYESLQTSGCHLVVA